MFDQVKSMFDQDMFMFDLVGSMFDEVDLVNFVMGSRI